MLNLRMKKCLFQVTLISDRVMNFCNTTSNNFVILSETKDLKYQSIKILAPKWQIYNLVPMSLKLLFTPYQLKFNFDAGTSRGVLKEKEVWFLKVFEGNKKNIYGIGEVATIIRLSADYNASFQDELAKITAALSKYNLPNNSEEILTFVSELVPERLPSIRFALETAMLDLLNEGQRIIFENDFVRFVKEIPINGLIWMGEEAFMKEQIDAKLEAGFSCIKMKIGSIDFKAECNLLRYIRQNYPKEKLTLRVDANGAFRTEDCMLRLKALEEFALHSIEQPIMPKQPESMSLLVNKSKIPIALDEELIGVNRRQDRVGLLEEIRPAYVVLKPGLLGGFKSTMEWIEIAESKNIGWWITSALESNIGLNAICQFTAQYQNTMHQGLGTGQLFENNIPSPLKVKGEAILYDPNGHWDLTGVEF
jgi:L-alanine-DL-glutamate epimerase-like enolase superfamily enzyme